MHALRFLFNGTQVGDEVLHIELRRWADVMVLAPLSANTLAKVRAVGGEKGCCFWHPSPQGACRGRDKDAGIPHRKARAEVGEKGR